MTDENQVVSALNQISLDVKELTKSINSIMSKLVVLESRQDRSAEDIKGVGTRLTETTRELHIKIDASNKELHDKVNAIAPTLAVNSKIAQWGERAILYLVIAALAYMKFIPSP